MHALFSQSQPIISFGKRKEEKFESVWDHVCLPRVLSGLLLCNRAVSPKKYSFSSVSAMSQSSAYLSDGQKVWQQRHLSRGKARVKVLGECRCPLDEEMEVLYSRDVVHDGRPS